jgi:hypothetical protein
VSQVATKKRLTIRNEHVTVTGHFHEHGSVLAGTAEGFCDSFEVEIEIESDEPPGVIGELIRLSRRMCFTEVALAGQTPVTVSSRLNGQPFPVQG